MPRQLRESIRLIMRRKHLSSRRLLTSIILPSIYARLNSQSEEITSGFIVLSIFLAVNLLICLWEISLFFYFSSIRKSYLAKKKKLPKSQLGTIFLFQHVPLSKALTLKFWGEVWATYGLVDESYANDESFGWCVDIGNGFSTLIPTLLLLICLSIKSDINSMLSIQNVGLIGFTSFWQELYGTILYFVQFIRFKRWKKHQNTFAQVFFLVILSNPIWIVVPAYGMYVTYWMIINGQIIV
eukprot:snap_masked-scaffold_1-processed-gene-22.56-mRNA-1 protein AED:1.00 eAED:1.00 QI:0/0/0/0/1/1/2/0/239